VVETAALEKQCGRKVTVSSNLTPSAGRKPMKKLFTLLAILLALVLVVLGAGSLLLHIYLPPEKAKALVLDRLRSQLHREVKLDSVDVGLLSGLQITGLKVSESPDFSKGTFLSSRQFSLKVALWPLMFRKVIVRQIVLKSPEVNVIRHPDGKTFNFSDLTKATTPSPVRRMGEGGDEGKAVPSPVAEAATPSPGAGPGEGGFPFLLLVSRAEIQKGALRFIDQSPAKQSVEVSPFDLKLRNVSLTTPFSVQTSMQVKCKETKLALQLSGDANLFTESFKIKQGILQSRQSKVSVSGSIGRLASSNPIADLKIEIPQLDPADFLGLVALPPALKTEGALSGRASVKGDQTAMDLSAVLDASRLKLAYEKVFVKTEKTPLTLNLQGRLIGLQNLDLQNIKMVLGPLNLTGHGHIDSLKSPAPVAKLHLESNAFPLDQILDMAPGLLPPGTTLKGPNQISADISGDTSSAQFAVKWNGDGLTIAKDDFFAKPSGYPLSLSLVGSREGPAKTLIKDLSVRFGPNQLTGAGTYETRGTQGFVQFSAKASKWSMPELAKVSPLLMPYHPTGWVSFDARTSGPTQALQTSLQTSAELAMANVKHEFFEGKDIQLRWNLAEVTPDLSRVSGTASLKTGPGKILNVEKLAASSRIGQVALLPLDTLAKVQKKGLLKEVNLPSMQSIPFDSVVGDYLLRSGMMDVKTFDLNGRDLSLLTHGSIGLAGAQPLNLTVSMKLAAGTVGGTLGNLVKDETGRPVLRFTVTGTLADPKVKLDLQEVGKKALQEVGKEIMKNKDVQNAVEDLQKSLKGLFR
jgi:hypothetical protein